jgi:hypothetical protein
VLLLFCCWFGLSLYRINVVVTYVIILNTCRAMWSVKRSFCEKYNQIFKDNTEAEIHPVRWTTDESVLLFFIFKVKKLIEQHIGTSWNVCLSLLLWSHVSFSDPPPQCWCLFVLPTGHYDERCRRCIHKVSSVCKYCHCSAVITTVRMHAEFVGPLGRHGRDLQTVKLRLRIVLCVYNIQENQEARCMWNALCNPFLECRKREIGWYSLSTLWGVWRTCHEWFNGTEMGETL